MMKSTHSRPNLVVETKPLFTFGCRMHLVTVKSIVEVVVRKKEIGSTYSRTSSPTATTKACSEQTHLLCQATVLLLHRAVGDHLNPLLHLNRRERMFCRCPNRRRLLIFSTPTRILLFLLLQAQAKTHLPAEVRLVMPVPCLRLRTALLVAPLTYWVPAQQQVGDITTAAVVTTPLRDSQLLPVGKLV